jgi:hypothetical protein
MLVPEIALTPAAAALFRQAFGERVAIQHSGLSDGERHDQWQRIRRGEIDIVIGTRSAVFAPLEKVGLIVVDEEHDGSYKQEESPRYNGRDVAIVRAQRAGALVVLGSATPSMESYHNAMSGRYEAWIDKQIREAQERGDFDDLPGLGRPLPGGGHYDEEWWLKSLAARENLSAALPPALALRKEVEDLPAKLARLHTETAVRVEIDDLNTRIRRGRRGPVEGPPVSVNPVDAEAAVRAWRAAREDQR